MVENSIPELAQEAEGHLLPSSESAENALTDKIIGAAIEVHRNLGPGLEGALKMDLIVEQAIAVEIKATEGLSPIRSAQLLSYLKASDKRVGLLINFNVPILKNGLRRIVNHHARPPITTNASAPSELGSPSAPRLRASASKGDSAVSRRTR